MSYELLTGLYLSESANADLTAPEARARLHLSTPLEDLVAAQVRAGRDVVLTGNPGDGKSHLVRTLLESGRLGSAVLELDLSARPTEEVLEAWQKARDARRAFVLCGNEGPLADLLGQLEGHASLGETGAELRTQLGSLLVQRDADLPHVPRHAVLVDLADRNVVDIALIEAALARVASEDFLPNLGANSTETSAGRNLLLILEANCRRRLAHALVAAGRHASEHVTFRQLWGTIAYALTRAKKATALRAELARDAVGLGTLPLDNLVHDGGRGQVLEAARLFADPARVPDPELEEHLWSTAQPGSGSWLIDDVPISEPPARLWAVGDRAGALRLQAQLKRLVALAHERGEALIEGLGARKVLPSALADADLLRLLVGGLRSLYVPPEEEDVAPSWLRSGLPLWVGLSYKAGSPEARPHVAVSVRAAAEFEVRRPRRAPWLTDALGPLPEEAWLVHRASGVALHVDAELVATAELAARSSGPLAVPEAVQRFIARLSGWEEQGSAFLAGEDRFAILSQPRGKIEAHGHVRAWAQGGASYGVG